MTSLGKSGLGRLGQKKKKAGAKKPGAASTVPTGRQLSVEVKTAHKRSVSSTLWLKRQLNDPYVAEAKKQGWRSRAAFKILQIDEKFKLFKPNQRVVDLGAAPGGWTQVAVQRVKPEQGRGGTVVAIDYLEMEPLSGAIIFQADFTHDGVADQLKDALGGPADLVLSDMAPPTTGHTQTDHLRIVALAEMAASFATEVLGPGGAFVCKLFQGGADKDLMVLLKAHFKEVRHVKPPSSRSDSVEQFIVATGFRK